MNLLCISAFQMSPENNPNKSHHYTVLLLLYLASFHACQLSDMCITQAHMSDKKGIVVFSTISFNVPSRWILHREAAE